MEDGKRRSAATNSLRTATQQLSQAHRSHPSPGLVSEPQNDHQHIPPGSIQPTPTSLPIFKTTLIACWKTLRCFLATDKSHPGRKKIQNSHWKKFYFTFTMREWVLTIREREQDDPIWELACTYSQDRHQTSVTCTVMTVSIHHNHHVALMQCQFL